jgi:hypothetical protein
MQGKLDGERLRNIFNKFWPDLEDDIEKLPSGIDDKKLVRTDSDKIEEILEIARDISRQLKVDWRNYIGDFLAKSSDKPYLAKLEPEFGETHLYTDVPTVRRSRRKIIVNRKKEQRR